MSIVNSCFMKKKFGLTEKAMEHYTLSTKSRHFLPITVVSTICSNPMEGAYRKLRSNLYYHNLWIETSV